ncbi:MAG: hypothetical protein ACI8UO_004944 [Verrucomicrobiales bacterium]|jgi:hypothetical protein
MGQAKPNASLQARLLARPANQHRHPEAAAATEQLLGRMSAGRVLITSRLGDWSAQVGEFDLDVLSEDAAAFGVRWGASSETPLSNCRRT